MMMLLGSAAPMVVVAVTLLAVPGDRSASQQSTVPSARSADEITIPEGEVALGSVRVPMQVLADGKPLKPGTYRLKLTGDTAAPPDVPGQTAKLERWLEFLQGSEVKGREVAVIVPGGAIKDVAEGTPPRPGRHRVERLKQDDYLRIWVNKGGDHILLHMPIAK